MKEQTGANRKQSGALPSTKYHTCYTRVDVHLAGSASGVTGQLGATALLTFKRRERTSSMLCIPQPQMDYQLSKGQSRRNLVFADMVGTKVATYIEGTTSYVWIWKDLTYRSVFACHYYFYYFLAQAIGKAQKNINEKQYWKWTCCLAKIVRRDERERPSEI